MHRGVGVGFAGINNVSGEVQALVMYRWGGGGGGGAGTNNVSGMLWHYLYWFDIFQNDRWQNTPKIQIIC